MRLLTNEQQQEPNIEAPKPISKEQIWATKDFYGVLGVLPLPSVSEREITRSYLGLVLKWHPDKWSEDITYPPENQTKTYQEVEARFKEIKEAYAVLNNKKE